MGIVYEALDEKRKERVALKTLGSMDGASVYKLKKEFRLLADLAHENLVRLHELFSDRGRWFFTMERIDGLTFLAYVREDARLGVAATVPENRSLAFTAPLDVPKLRSALAQLV